MMADVSSYLGDSAGILFYSLEQDTLRVWLVGGRGLRGCSTQRTGPRLVDSLVRQLHRSLSKGRLAARGARQRGVGADDRPQKVPDLPVAIKAVTDVLLPKSLRQELKAFSNLIVVPTNSIGIVPFGLLQPDGPGTYLIDRSSIAVAPSFFDIFHGVDRWRKPERAVVVGNPILERHPVWDFPPLHGAEREAVQVGTILGSAPLIGYAATRDSIISRIAADEPDLLYIAAHGVASATSPLDSSFIALGGSGGQGWWTARQIQRTRLSGIGLVVLSACQTGLGQSHTAGIIGLARGFQLAGVPRVVMSLWNVDDESAAAFMADFANGILHYTPNKALQQAMIRMRARDPDPRHWAAFEMFGSIK